jgi:hypothetical protein
MNLKFTHCIIALTLLLISGCCKSKRCQCNEKYGERVDDCTPKHYGPYYLGEVKDYLYFKPGSWWVYKNDLSNEIDSIYTVTCDTFTVNSRGNPKKWLTLTYIDLSCHLRSDKYNADYYYDMPNLYPDITDFQPGYLFDRTASFPTVTRTSTPFAYPFKDNGSHLFQQLLTSLIVQGKTYNDVAVFQIWSDESVQLPSLGFGFETSAPTKYFWAKGVGLIKIEQMLYRYDTQSTFLHKWELINYNLVK